MADNVFDDPEFGGNLAPGDSKKTAAKAPKNVFDDPEYGKETGIVGGVGNTLADAGSGVITGFKGVTDALGAGNAASRALGDANDAVRGFQSGGRRAEQDARNQKIQDAEDSGSTWEEIKANVGAFTEAPIDTTVNALGTSVPAIAAMALTRGRAPALTGAAVGAVQGAGFVKGSIYDAVEQEHLQNGATPEEAAARAEAAQRYSSDNAGQIALGAGLGAVAGSTGVEAIAGRMLGREAGEHAAQGVLRSAGFGALTEAPLEAAQGGQERLASNIALQNEGFDVPTWQGVAGQAAMEGIAGAAGGGAFGAVEGYANRPAAQPATEAGDAEVGAADIPAQPRVEPMQGDAQPQGGQPLGLPAPVWDVGPDGTVRTTADQNTPREPFTDRTPVPTQSERMGLDPNAGPLSAAAAQAVDSGASQQLADQAAMQQAAEVAQAQQKEQAKQQARQQAKASAEPQAPTVRQGESVDPLTGEIIGSAPADQQAATEQAPADRAAELQQRLDFIANQARGSGWDGRMIAERDQVRSELESLQRQEQAPQTEQQTPQVRAKDAAKQVLESGGSEADASRAATDSLIDDMQRQPELSISQEAPAAVQAAAEEVAAPAAPANLQEGLAQARANRAEKQAEQPAAAGIQSVIAKQIPQMTDAELSQAIEHYGPDHKRTKKLQKELAKRQAPAAADQQQVEQPALQQAPAAADVAPAAPEQQPAPAETSPQQEPAPAQVQDGQRPAPSLDDAGARWDAMTPEQRRAVADASGAKPVFAKNLQTADWSRIASGVKQKLAEAMPADQMAVKDEPPAVSSEQQQDAPASQTTSVEGRDLGEGWAEFTPESGTLNVPRAEMPQIKAEHRGAMVNFLNARGIAHQEETVPASDLKPTQAEFSREKVARARDFDGGNRSILASRDGHVLDGHHQWIAARENNEDVKVIRLDAPIRELVQAAHDFPSSTTEQGTADTVARRPRGEEVSAAAEQSAPDATDVPAAAPRAEAAPEAATASKDADRFAGNKVFTADAVAAARARMKAKLGQLNSGIDPELMMDGMTIAGAYIESGVRSFADYAKAMVEDMGDAVKPYLLSFWEAARHYPGVDKSGMTSAEESARLHAELLTTAVKADAAEAVGTVAEKPKTRSKKTGAKGDMVLTQDWGVEHINGYGDSERETGNDTKDAFLKETRNYLNAVADALRTFGFEPHLDRKGKPEKPVSVNESGIAGSGDVSLTMRNEGNGNNAYITIGDTSLRGVVPSTPSGIAIMYRVAADTDRYAAKAGNTWAPVDLSANDLAALVNSRVRPATKETRNEQPADGAGDQGRAQEVRGGRERDPQPGSAQADSGNVEARQPADDGASDQAGDSGRPGVRGAGTDVASQGSVPEGRNATDRRPRAGRAGSSDAGTGAERGAADGAAAAESAVAELTSPAAASVAAKDLHIADPLEIVGGTPVQRFNRNRQALELLQQLEEEGRQATPEEQRILAGYIGWGSFGQELFQGSWERPQYRDEGVWKERGEWLRNTLGESAWKSAQRSITNAHYTDPPTVMAMWDMVRRMGFTGGKVLEPSMGTGNFFSMMPEDIKARSQLTGIELDETTGAIAKQLFPKSNVRVMGYQDSQTPDNFYDLVIGNWPFENTPIADRRYNKLNPMLHDYFFLKTMDQVRPGGIVIGITSAGSMDKQNTGIRRELAKQAELVASIRLPSGAFSEYAGTKVVTDIVILRKRPERLVAVPREANWVETGEFHAPGGKLRVNQYYLSNPQNIIGQLDFGHGTTTFRAGMIVHRPENMAERLRQAVNLVPEGAMQPPAVVDHLTYYANETGERHGAIANVGDRLMVARGDQLVLANDIAKYDLKDSKKTAAREAEIKAAVGLRQLHSALVDAERRGEEGTQQRKALRDGYNAFVKAHGKLRDSYALAYMDRIEDPFYAELAALENDDGKPAAVMQRSTTRSKPTLENPSVRDAYVLARNQAVNPSIEQVAELAGKPVDAVRRELLDSGAVFEAPNGDVLPSDIYLSGNVREKMREAKAALDDGNKAMQRNVDALAEVMPQDVPYFNIETKLGATWVQREAYQGYIAHMLSRDKTDGIEVDFANGRWKVRLGGNLNQLPEASANYGTPEYRFAALVQAAMSNQTLRLKSKDENGNDVYDPKRTEEVNARLQKIREDFGAWLWSDPERRVAHEREYNEARNAWATPTYDGSFLSFEGMALSLGNGPFNLRQHQVNAIWRAIVNRRSLNAHEVGTGKTFTMGGIAVESRRYGIAKKPVILAHNANSATVAAEIRMMYPSARVLYVDNLDPKNRDLRLRQIANDDWDAIVLPHSLIDRLALREETLMQMAEDDIAALESEFFDAAGEEGQSLDRFNFDFDNDDDLKKVRSVTAKELAKARKRIIENIKKQAQQSSKEGAVTFEDLGIDMVLVDEVHEFKKPPIVTRMQMKGLNTQTSGRSIALQFLTRYVRQMNNGGNVHTFTGTPITNTITEIYHQMRYVMEAEMDQAGVPDWDGWFGSFATEVQDVELSAAGDYEMVTRLAGFVNVPELRRMVGQYMDTVFAEDMPEMKPRQTASGKTMADELSESERGELLNGRTEGAMDRPYKKVINASVDMTAEQTRIFTQLQQYAVDWRNATARQRKEWSRQGDPRSPMIAGNIADMASFDVRRLDESLAGMEGKTNDDPTSKVSRAVSNVLEIYNSHPQANQVIFSDQGTNKTVRRTRTSEDGEKVTTTHKVFATSYDIVERLVQGGIPRDQIAIVDGSTSKERRKEIAKAMNESRIRVVLGSTDALGVGVNMQRNLRAMHHLDAPYMPGELEQRNGRGQRQGNQWNTVLEYRYMTDRLDGKRWQILAVKQRFITAFMKANSSVRNIEGEAAADEQSDILESFSEAAGDPRVLQRVKMQKKLESLQRKERMYTQGIADMRSQARYSEREASELTEQVGRADLAGIQAIIDRQRDNFSAQIDGKNYSERKEALAALEDYFSENARVGDKQTVIGTYAGLPLTYEWSGLSESPTTAVEYKGERYTGKGIAGVEAKLRNYPQKVAELERRRDAALATVQNMRQAMQQPFAQAEELQRVEKQLADLEQDLSVNPVPPPSWLRQGAPVDSEVFRKGKPYIVTGHRYSQDGWFVIAEDAKGTVMIPYMEATDNVGMALYDEREFVPPVVQTKQGNGDADPVPQFSFAGRSAQGADRLALGTAQRRIGAGEDAETVRQDTGWFRGTDGKWRFEISDDQAELSVGGRTAGEVIAMAKLSAAADGRATPTVADMLDHPQLFAAYPDLASIPVSTTPADTTVQARLGKRATGLKLEIRAAMPRSRIASAMLHELQHAIQVREGFALGGSKKTFTSDLDRSGSDTYRRLAGEVEARNTQTRQRMTPRLRRDIAPEESADVSASDSLVSFNGRDINVTPQNAVQHPALTVQSLRGAFDLQFPALAPALRRMLERGKAGQRGGVVLIDSADPLRIADTFARKTGTSFNRAVQVFEEGGKINGFYDAKSGLTFLVGPNLDVVTGPAVLLHEMTHGQQRQKLDQAALAMLMNRTNEKNPELRAFFDRVAARMVDAGEGANAQEASAYIVEQAVIEGRSQGFAVADSRFLSWVDRTIGKKVGDLLRSTLAMVRSWMLRNGMSVGPVSVDDLVGYAMAGMQRAADGNVAGVGAGQSFSREQTKTEAFKRWFGNSKVVDASGKPLALYHGTPADFSVFDRERIGSNFPAEDSFGFFFTTDPEVARQYGSNIMPVYLKADTVTSFDYDETDIDEWGRIVKEESQYADNAVVITKDGKPHIYIVFDPEQVKSAIGNRGTFDPENPDIRFSRSGMRDAARNAADSLTGAARAAASMGPGEMRAAAGRGVSNLLTDLKPALLGALPLNYLSEFAPRSLTALGQYIDQKRQMDADRNELHSKYDSIAQRWMKLRWGDRAATQGMADLMHAATIAGIDPSKPRKLNADAAEYDRLRKQYEALPAEHKAMFGEARDAYRDQVKLMERVIEDNIKKSAEFAKRRAARARDKAVEEAREELEGIDLDEAIEAAEKRYAGSVRAAEGGSSAKILLMRKRFEEMRVDEPYFPLKRFGDYFVAMRDGNKLVSFSMFESAASMNAAADELRKQYPGLQVKVGRQSIKQELDGAVDPAFVSDVQELVSKLHGGAELSDGIYQLYLNTLPDYSMRKGFIHRKKTAGFNTDALRAFSSSMFHSSYQIARLKHSLEMNEYVEQLEQQANNADNQVDAITISNELRKRHEWVMAPKGGALAQRITSAAFVYQLGITPAAAFVNTTQTFMMGIPVLGARFKSETGATRELLKASHDFIKGRGHVEKALAGDELKAFNEFERMGLIDKTQAHDLAGVGETGVEYNPVRHKVMGYISFMFHHAERYNREVTSMAAYRMSRAAGRDHEAAIKEAADLTWKTHFDYSSGNRARYMQGDTAKVLLVFRQHSVNMLSRLTSDIRSSLKGETPQVKAEAKRRLIGMFAMFALFAGAMGVPGSQALLMLANGIGGDDDDPFTVEDRMRKAVTEALGEELAAVFFHGVPGTLSGVSLTDRIGMGSLWFFNNNRELEGKDAYYYWMEQVLGAAPAMIGNAFVGASMASDGNYYRGLETAMPKAIKDLMRGARYGSEGVQTMSGDMLVDEVNSWQIIAQAMGFTPAQIAEQYERNSALKNAEQRILTERRYLMNRHAMAVRLGDDDLRAELREQISDFNQRFPQVRITPVTLMQSMRARAQRDQRTEGGVALDKRLEWLRDDL